MINNKEDLAFYLAEDRKHYKTAPTWIDWLLNSDFYYIWNFIKALRWMEYRTNNCKGIVGRLLLKYQTFRYYRLMHKTQLYIYPNVCGPGLYIPHLGYMLISAQAEIGCNCTIRPGTLIASNLGPTNSKLRKVIVGDNVEFSAGCKILCKRIGNNVSVGPNAVVSKNVPDNSIVMGNPGEIVPKINL